jgi:hypothetical protein
MKKSIGFLSFVLLVAPVWSAHAACNLPVNASHISAVPILPAINQSVRIYVSIQPECSQDVEGAATFFIDGEQLTGKPLSIKAQSLPEEVWALWTPTVYGHHAVRVDTMGDGGATGGSASIDVFVDRDTDGDGILDVADSDDDNDGVLDAQDQFPLDAARSKDTDGDGIDDKIDSDKDNDGLYNFKEETLGTDPLKRDTDGDAVGDKEDAFPLDPKRTEAPPPPAPAPVVAEPVPAEPVVAAAVEDPKIALALSADSEGSPVAEPAAVGAPVLEAATTLTADAAVGKDQDADADKKEEESEKKKDKKPFPTESQKLFAGLGLAASVSALGASFLLNLAKKQERG